MQDALPIVVIAVVVLAGLVGLAAVILSRGAHDHIGRGGLTLERDMPRPHEGPAAAAVRDEEIAQMLAATNARRAAQGRPLLELSELQAEPDPELVAEVRAFVENRNARRVARGLPPLDVEAEVEQRLSGQDG